MTDPHHHHGARSENLAIHSPIFRKPVGMSWPLKFAAELRCAFVFDVEPPLPAPRESGKMHVQDRRGPQLMAFAELQVLIGRRLV